MSKEDFLEELKKRLSGLPQEDIDERIAFYSEMIDDRMEDGVTEEAAVSGVGSIDSIVEQIMAEIPFAKLVKEKAKHKRHLKAWEIVLLVLGSPVWIPLLIAAMSVILSLYIVIWSVIISLYAVDVSFAACAFAGLIGMVPYLNCGNPAGAFFSAGAGIACAGLAILMFFACVWISKGVINTTGKILLNIKTSFVGEEA